MLRSLVGSEMCIRDSLCIHPCIHNDVSSHIVFEDEEIKSGESLKILGFTFDNKPNANKHIELLIERFYCKLWTLRYLKKSGLEEDRLLEVYNSSIRSAVEYCSNVYHTLIQQYQIDKLESIQRHALRIIFGYGCDIDQVMAAKNISTLENRREEAIIKFALKNEDKERFGKKWFQKNNRRDIREASRDNNKYIIPFCRTERMEKNPIVNMAKTLNQHYKNN